MRTRRDAAPYFGANNKTYPSIQAGDLSDHALCLHMGSITLHKSAPEPPQQEIPGAILRAQGNTVDCAVQRSRVTDLDVTDDQLRAINERNALDLEASEVLMFRDYVASTGPMRGRSLRFTPAAITRFAQLAGEGRPFVLHHDSNRYVGSTLSGSVEQTTVAGVEATWLAVDWYAVTRDASAQRRQDLIDIRTGLQYTSIRFQGGAWSAGDPDEYEGSQVMVIDDNPEVGATDRLEMPHISRVELGAVVGAGVDITNSRTEE